MRKAGKKRKVVVPSRIVLPSELSEKMLPLHTALELIPLGLFSMYHAMKLAEMVNIVTIDSAKSDDSMMEICREAGGIISLMVRRDKAGHSLTVTEVERKALIRCILAIDQHVRRWSLHRWRINIATLNEINIKNLKDGRNLMEEVEVDL